MRALSITAALLSATLLFAGCSGDDKKEPEAAPPPAEQAEPQTWPLTGIEAADGESVERTHPVLVAKIDNSASSSPQIGLSKADLVVEQLVEGRTTRLAAFFYSELPKIAGPIRSMRASDIGIVSPVDGQLVTSGAAGETKDRLARAGVKYHEEGVAGFSRDPARPQTYSVMVDLKEIAKGAKVESTRPDDYFTFGTPDELPAGKPAKGLAADFGNHTTTWAFANGTYAMEDGNAGQGDEFAATSVLVIRVQVVDAGYTDAGDNPVPESVFKGKGKAQLFHGGKVIDATWEKDGLSGALTLMAGDEELKVPAGKTWVELLPAQDAEVTVTR